MRVAVDDGQCQGHARCYVMAPTLLTIDDYEKSSAVDEGTVTAADEGAARLAIANSPEFAFTEVED